MFTQGQMQVLFAIDIVIERDYNTTYCMRLM